MSLPLSLSHLYFQMLISLFYCVSEADKDSWSCVLRCLILYHPLFHVFVLCHFSLYLIVCIVLYTHTIVRRVSGVEKVSWHCRWLESLSCDLIGRCIVLWGSADPRVSLVLMVTRLERPNSNFNVLGTLIKQISFFLPFCLKTCTKYVTFSVLT